MKVKGGGSDAVVTGDIGPQVVRVEHAVHAAVFVSYCFGAESAKQSRDGMQSGVARRVLVKKTLTGRAFPKRDGQVA
jgi:hypothetical protein